MEMINFVASAVETVGWLNTLAEKVKHGFFPFSECRTENKGQWEDAIVYMDNLDDSPAGMDIDDVVADMLVDDEAGHHDAFSGYSEVLSQLCDGEVRVSVEHHDEGDASHGPYKLVTVDFECVPGPLHVVIDDEGWYIA